MRTLAISLLATALLAAGCATTDRGPAPDRTVINANPNGLTRAAVIFVGGNSECRNDRGLLLRWDDIASDVSSALGLGEDELARVYYSWTGDEVLDPGCVPGLDAWGADTRIVRRLEQRGFLSPDFPLIIVGHSNGGATAFDLAATLCHEGRAPDLLVTLDPVSRLDRRAEYMGARTWLHVFVDRHKPIITMGGPWKGDAPEFEGHVLWTARIGEDEPATLEIEETTGAGLLRWGAFANPVLCRPHRPDGGDAGR